MTTCLVDVQAKLEKADLPFSDGVEELMLVQILAPKIFLATSNSTMIIQILVLFC
jgi:hypothetical protein